MTYIIIQFRKVIVGLLLVLTLAPYALPGYGFFIPLVVEAATGVPEIISYQGRLTDSSGNLLGGSGTNYYFKFSIWDDETVGGGTKLWPAGAPGTTTLSVEQGVFNVNIGDTVNGFPDALTYDFQTNDTTYLQVEVSSNIGGPFETLDPRQRITSTGYAINAGSVQGAEPGTGADNILLLDGSGDININGDIVTTGILQSNTLTPTAALTVGATSVTALLQGSITTITSTGAGNDIILNSADTIELQDNTNITGNLDLTGVINAGSSNINITLATGMLDADALGLITAGGTGSTSSGSGLEVVGDALGLLQGCANNEILKWNDAGSVWACAADVSGGGSGTLQDAYTNGNTITTTDSKDVDIVLADTTTDSNLDIDLIADNTVSISRNDGSSTESPAQLLLIENLDSNLTISAGINMNVAAGGAITTGVDLSDADIVTAFAIGNNDVTVGGATISAAEFAILDNNIDLTSEVTGLLPTANGGTGVNTSGATNGQLLIGNGAGLSLAALTQGSGVTITNGAGSITIASTLGVSVDLTAEVTGTLPVGNGGTGATSFVTGGILIGGATISDTGVLTNGQLLIGDGSGAPTISTLTQGTGITVTNGAGSITVASTLGTDIDSSEIVDNTITASDLNATLTFADGDILNLAAINTSSTTEGLILPQATSCTSGTAEGQICWDTDGDFLSLGTGASTVSILSSASSIFTLAGTSGTPQTITSGDTVTIAAGTGITTTAGATDTVTIAATLGTSVDLTSEVTGILPNANGGTGLNTSAATNGQLLIGNGSGFTLAAITQGSGITVTNGAGTITLASTLGTSVDLTSEVTGTLPVGNGGTGATTLSAGGILFGNGTSAIGATAVLTNGQLLIGDGTGEPTLATLTQGSGITITNGAGSISIASTLGTAIDSSEITDDVVSASDLAATLTFADGDLLNLSAINTSSTTEGLILPQATSCTSGTAEGQICWDTDNDFLSVGNGTTATQILTNSTTLFTLAGTSGTPQTITSGDTVTIAAGTGITTTAGATDTVTIAATLGTSVDLTSEVTGTLPVGNGGTGATTLSAGGILFGNGTSAIGATAVLTNGQLLIGDGTGEPTLATLTQGSGITITNGAGSITIAATDTSATNELQNIFETIAVATQSNVVADSTTDTLTIAAGTGVSITTDAGTDTITITNTVTDTDTGDEVSVNGSSTTGANFINTTATGTVAGTTFALNTVPSPDEITLTISNASDTVAGVVTTGTQTFAGAKTLTSNVTINKADSSIIFDTATATDTDFWLGVQDDAGSDDDDLFQIGDGVTPGSNAFLTINTSGNVGVGTSNPGTKLTILGGNLTVRETDDGNNAVALASTASAGFIQLYETGATKINLTAVTGSSSYINAGNFGIGDTTPAALFTVGNGDLFQVDSSGNVSAAAITGTSFVRGSDTITDFTGTGLQLNAGALETSLGTSVDLTSEVTGTLPVGNGGTGATTLSAGGILFGNGTSAIGATAVLTNGQLLIGDGTGEPTLATLTQGSGITITNGAGSITIAATDTSATNELQNIFETIAVATQSNVVADSTTDTLTLVAGTGTTITTNATTDEITLATTLGTSVDLTSEVTGILPLANGGTNKNFTASAGSIVYSDADSFEASAVGTSGQALISGGTGAPTWFAPTAGSVLFAGTSGILEQDNANFFFDNTSNELGIGTTNPESQLEVQGTEGNDSVITLDADDGDDTTDTWFIKSLATGNALSFENDTTQVASISTTGALQLDSLISGGTQCVQANSSGVLSVTGSGCGSSTGISTLTLAGSSGTPQSLVDADTITIAAGTGITTTAGATDTVTIAATLGTSVDLTSEVTGTLPVGNGGTGATTLSAGGILFGNGTSAIGATAVLTNGQLLIGDGTGEPTLATLTQGSGITITNGAGSITIAATDTSATNELQNIFETIAVATQSNVVADSTTDTLTLVAGTGTTITTNATTDEITLATTLGTSVDLTSEVTGILPLANGGTNKNFTASAGSIVYSDADSFEASAVGTSGQALISGGTGAPTWFAPTAGSVLFAGTSGILEQDNANFFFDNTSNELGIGTTNPESLLEVQGTEGNDSVITLDADDGDDTTDTWFIKSLATGNALSFENDTTQVASISTTGALQLDSLISGGTQCVQANSSGVLSVTGSGCGSSTGISTLTLAGSSGTPQSLVDADTITIAAGTGITTTAGATDTVTIAATLGTSVDLTSEVTGTLPVGNGGTGATTLSAGGILFGNGTSAIGATAVLTNGQLLIGDGTGEPTLATLTQGSGITITNGAGSITIAATDTSATNELQNIFETIAVATQSNVVADSTTDTLTLVAGTGTTITTNATTDEITLATTLGTSVDLTSEVTGILPLANGGTNKNFTASAGSIVYSDADSFEASAVGTSGQALISGGTGAPTWFAPTAGSVLFAGTSGILQQDNTNFFWDDSNNRLGLGDTTPDAVLDIELTSTSTSAGTLIGSAVVLTDTGVVISGSDDTFGQNIQVTRTGATGGSMNTRGTNISVVGDDAGSGLSFVTGSVVTVTNGDYVSGIDVLVNNTSPSSSIYGLSIGADTDASTIEYMNILIASNLGGVAPTSAYGLYIADVLGSTDYGIYQLGSNDDNYFAGNVGIGDTTPASALTVGNGDLFQVTSSGLVINTVSLTNTSSINDINLTLGNDADVDTISAINIDVTSAATGDADVVYGLNIGNLTSADGTVLERALRIGSGWDEAIDVNGTLISLAELQALDGGISLTSEVTGILPLANGGTNKNFTASAGSIVYSDADSFEASAVGTSGQALISGGTGAPTWFAPTAGSVLFAGTSGILEQDNANFFFDNTSNELGIGTTNPESLLEVQGTEGNDSVITLDADDGDDTTDTWFIKSLATGNALSFENDTTQVASISTTGALQLDSLISGGTQCVQANSSGVLSVTGSGCGSSTGISTLTLAGSSGTPQSLVDADTITIAAGTGITTTAGATDTVTIAATLGTSVDLTTEVTGTLPVGNGGTGATTLSAGGILFGNGTSAIGATAVLTNGQLLIGDGTGEPTLATLTQGSGITITNGAGSITIAATDTSATNELQNIFETIAVATQSNVVADSTTDTLTIAAGTGVSITTDAGTDTITITNTVTDTDTGDEVSVNGSSTTGANFINTTATGTVAGTTFALNTVPSPDEITLTISNASGTVAGVVTTGTQTFAGDKIFSGNVDVNGILEANGALYTNANIYSYIDDGEYFNINSDSNSDWTSVLVEVRQNDDVDATDDLVGFNIALSNESNDAGDTITGFSITNSNNAYNQVTDAFISLENFEVSAAVTSGIIFGNTGVITTAINVSASNIGTALNVGSNDIVGTTGLINYTNFDVDSSGNVSAAAITGTSFVRGSDTITDFTGTGLTLNAGALETTLGTSVDLTSEVTGTLPVGNGGTGATTLSAGGILFGNGTSAIGATAVLTNGQLLIGDGTGEPTLATLTQGSGITITNGAGSITIAATDTSATNELQNIFETIAVATQSNVVADSTTDTLTLVAGTGTTITTNATTDEITLATTLGTSVDLTSEVTGILPLANGGTNKNFTASAGSIVYSDADSFEASAVGTSGQALISGGTGAPTWFAPTAGSVLFAGTSGILEQDNANFFFDNTSNELGIGTTNPESLLEVQGTEGNDSVITLDADDGDDTTDTWFIKSLATGNALSFENDTTQVASISTTGALQLDSLISGGTQCVQANSSGVLSVTGSGCGSSTGISTLTLAGSSGTPQSLVDADTITIAAGTGITTTAGATDTVTIAATLGTSVDLTSEVTGILPLANGGTNKNFTASNGSIVYSDADSFEASAVGTSGQALISGGTGAPTWFAPTAGSVLFAGTSGILEQDNANLFWDDTNNRLGLGDTTPDAVLDVNASSTSTSAGTFIGSELTVIDTGVVTTGVDLLYGNRINLSRSGGTGGTMVNTGQYIDVTGSLASGSGAITNYGQQIYLLGDTTGTSNNIGLLIDVSGADTNYAAIFSAGNVGIGDTTPASALTVGNGDLFQVTSAGLVINTVSLTNTSSINDVNLTLGNDADADTISAINIDVTSAATGDADVVYGLNIGNLTSANATVLERALRIGSGWDEAIDVNGTLISLAELQALDGGIDLTSEVSGILPLANGGTNKNFTASAGSIVYSDADSFEASAVGTSGQALISGGTGAPTWFAPTAGSVLFAGTSGILEQDNANFFWDDTNNRLGIGTTSPSVVFEVIQGSAAIRAHGTSNGLNPQITVVNTGTGGEAAALLSGTNYSVFGFSDTGYFQIDKAPIANFTGNTFTGGNGLFRVSASGGVSIGDVYVATDSGADNLIVEGKIGIGATSPEALLEVQGIEATDAVIALDADDGDDNTDTWFIKSLASGNALSFENHTTQVASLTSAGALQLDSLISGGTQCLQADTAGTISGTGSACGTATGTLFTLAGTSGTPQTISASDTVTIAAGTGITTTAGATDTVTIAATLGTSVDLTSEVTGILPLANGGTNKNFTASAGSIVYSDADSFEASAVGTSGQALISGGTGAPTWFAPTAGSVLFAGTSGILEQDNANFFWDDSSNELGIGDNTPDATLDVNGNIEVNNSITSTGILYLNSGVGSGQIYMTTSGSNTELRIYDSSFGDSLSLTHDSTNAIISTNTGSVLIQPTSGNVGIGDSTPASMLTVGNGELFQVTSAGLVINTVSLTNTSSINDINLTLGNDADVDTISAINIDVTSAATGDADVVYGLNIGNLTSADATVLERALRIGSGWDEAIDVNGTLISLAELQALDGGISLTTEVSGTLPLANGGTNKNFTASAGSIVYSDADSFEASAVGTSGQALISGGTGAPTWFAPTAGSVLFAGTSGILEQDNANFFWDDTNNRLGIGDNTPEGTLDVFGSATNVALASTLDVSSTYTTTSAGSYDYAGINSVVTHAGNANNTWGVWGTYTEMSNTNTATTAAAYGIRAVVSNDSSGTITSAFGASISIDNSGTITNGYGISINDIVATNDYAIYQQGANDDSYFAGRIGIGDTTPASALTVGSGELFQVTSAGLVINTVTLTATSSINDVNLTLGNDADADTISAINIDVTSAATGDADVVYGVNIGNLTSADATVLERALRIGSGWDEAIDVNGTLISSTELAYLDGGISLTTEVTGILPLANGGTNKNFTASAGSIVYSDADSFEASAVGTSGQALISGGTGAPTWFAPTAGSVLFAGTSGILAQDNTNYFWDDTNNRLGIGDITPDTKFDISHVATNSSEDGISVYLENTVNSAGSYSIEGMQIEIYESATQANNGIIKGLDVIVGSDNTASTNVINGVETYLYDTDAGSPGSMTGYWVDIDGTAAVAYGVYIASINATTSYGIYQSTAGDENYFAGNVGIGDTTPASALTVGNGDLFQVTSAGLVINTVTLTNTSSINDINLTLGNDADVDTISAINIDVTSAATGDADVVYGVNIGNLTSADGTVLERALRIGSGWDEAIDANGTLISLAELQALDGGISLTSEVSGVLPLANGGTNKNFTASAGSIVYSDADSFEASAVGTSGQALISGGTGAPTWFAPTAGSVLFAGTSGILAQDNTNFFWDDTNNRLGLGDITPDGVFDITTSSTSTSGVISYGTNVTIVDTGVVTSGFDVNTAHYADISRSGATGGTLNNTLYGGQLSGNSSAGTTTVTNYGLDLLVAGDTNGTSINYGVNINVLGADTNYSGIFMGGNFGILDTTPASALTVGSGELFQVTSAGLVINTVTLTATSSINDVNLTLGNDADADTISAINIDVTSAATGDADIVYGLNIGNLTSADGTVLERALRIGSGWDEAIDVNGTLISSTELAYLDGGIDLTSEVSGILPLANGGTNKNFTASAGSIVYSDADSFEASAVGTSGQALISGGTGAPTWFAPTAGSVLFAGTSGILEQDNANFFFDNTSNELGIGTTNPESLLEVQGTEGNDSVITLDADDGDDTTDTWFIKSLATGNALSFENDTTQVASISTTGALQLDSLISGGTQCVQANSSGVLSVTGSGCGSSTGISTLTLAGSSGTPQSLVDADTITIAAGTGITTTAGATDTVTIAATLGTSVDLTSEVTGILPLANGGTNKNFTASAGSIVYSDADSFEASAVGTSGQALISGGTGAPTWFAPTAGSVLFAGTSGVLTQDNSGLFFDESTNELGIGTATPGANLQIHVPVASDSTFYLSDADVAHGVTGSVPTDVYGALSSLNSNAGGLLLRGFSDDTNDTPMSIFGTFGSTDPNDTTPAVRIRGVRRSGINTTTLGGLETVFTVENSSSVLMSVLGSGNVGIGDTTPASALTVGSGELFQVTSAGLVINTVTLTATSSINDVNLTLGNDADADTISAINIDVTSAATGDADIVYGLNIGNLTSADGTVLERALRIGSGWDEAIDVNGTLISLSELQALDGGISLTSEVSGTLPVGNGGTGTSTTFTTGSIVFAGGSGIYSQDNSNFFWDDTNNRLGLGANSSLKTALHVVGTVTTSGADAVATIFSDSTLNNSTASGFQFGARMLNTVSSTVAGSHVGQFIRMTDSTSLSTGQIVRGLEVQAYSGTNNNGVNTGIATYGKTFGIQAETTAQAGAVSQPAAVFADLNNSSDGSLGNAIRAYTDNATSATLVSLYQETSAMTGVGMNMNLGNGAGSFTGNFIELQKAGASKFTVDDTGRTDIAVVDADNAIALYINTEESTVSQSVFAIESDTTGNSQSADTVKAHFEADGSLFVSLTGTQTTNALCHASTGMANNDEIVDCSGAPSDLAEYFGAVDGSITAAEVVVSDSNASETVIDGYQTSKAWIKRSSTPYENNLVGVISTAPSQVFGDEIFTPAENPRPVALAGRVPVKVNLQNGAIKRGDYLTSSSIPGVAMKATRPGMVIGQALNGYDGTQSQAQVVVMVNTSYYDPTILVEADGSVTMQRGESTTSLIAESSTTAFLINQKGSGDLLQVQTDGVNRFAVQNNGAVNINAISATDIEEIFVVESTDGKAFAINSRGDVELAGVIVVKDDTFAGSIATDENGEANIEFTYHLGTGKPVVQLTPESESPVFAQVVEWTKDIENNYTGFKMKTFGLNGDIASAVVHYNVVGKQTGYETSGEVIQVVDAPSDLVTDGGSTGGEDAAGDTGDGSGATGGEVTSGPEGDSAGGEIPAGDATEGTVAGEGTTTSEDGSSEGESSTPTDSSNNPDSGSGSEPGADAGSGI